MFVCVHVYLCTFLSMHVEERGQPWVVVITHCVPCFIEIEFLTGQGTLEIQWTLPYKLWDYKSID